MAAGWAPLHLVGARSQEDYTSQNAARKTLFPIGRIGLTTSPRMLQAFPLPPPPHGLASPRETTAPSVLYICPRNLDCSSLASEKVEYLVSFSAAAGAGRVRRESDGV